MNKVLLVAAIVCFAIAGNTIARAQSQYPTPAGYYVGSSVMHTIDGGGVAHPISPSNPLSVTGTFTPGGGSSGTPTQTSITCGTSSTPLLAASTATVFVHIRNPKTNTATVWINYAGSAAVAASPSDDIPPDASADFSTASFLPTSAIACIASSSTVVTVSYK